MPSTSTSKHKWPLRISGALFALFVGNVLVGKASVLMGGAVLGMGDVAEFLTLFGAAATFVVAVLIKEGAQDAPSPDQP